MTGTNSAGLPARRFHPAFPSGKTRPAGPAFLRGPIFPGPVQGPWRWPALEDARSRHLAALEALKAARETEDAEAERAALIEVCEVTVDGAAAINATMRSAENAYRDAARAVRASLPINAEGFVPSAERRRFSKIVREAREWTEPDLKTLRRCQSLVELEHFYGGRSVCRLTLQVEEWRAAELDEAVDLGEASFEPPEESEHDDRAA